MRTRNVVTVVHRDRLYVPEHAVSIKSLRNYMEVKYETKEYCSPGCPLAAQRGRYCSTCPGRDARIVLWSRVRTRSGKSLIAIAGGDRTVLDRIVVGEYRVVDRRADPPFRSNLRWTGRLRTGRVENGRNTADQRGLLASWRRAVRAGETGGVLVSPPRSGKCVIGDTIIRTDAGYHRIESMFSGRSTTVEVEEIGRFGKICTPTGVQSVRGIYAQTVAEIVLVELQIGATIGGSLRHPVLTLEEDGQSKFIPLGQLTGREFLVLAKESHDPVPAGQGLTEDQATLVGMILQHAEYSRWCGGVLHLSPQTIEEYPQFRTLLMGACRLEVRDSVMCRVDSLPVLREWRQLLMASTRDAWRAFVRAAFIDDPDVIGVRLPDQDLARATQFHLLSNGVMCVLSSNDTSTDFSIEVVSVEGWDAYLRGERSDEILSVPINSIRRVMRPCRVMDLMVPKGNQFYTNGIVSHNTVIGVAAALAERSRTLVTASKIDFLRQFGKRFGELTNLRELYSRGQHPVILVDPKGWRDGPQYGVHVLKRWTPEVDRADVVMSCFQQFLDSDLANERKRRYLNGKFGLIVGDEIHQSASKHFSKLLGRLDARRKLGLTATIERKDRTQDVVLKILGPVRGRSNAASDLPLIELLETGISGKNYSFWPAMTKFLIEMDERNKIIVRQVFRDLRAHPRHSILVTTTRRSHIAELVKLINANALFRSSQRGENWPTDLAVSYYGKTDTSAVLDRASSGRTRVVVAMASMVQHGLDVARWTHVYIGIVPTSNPYSTYQLINRVCTPYDVETERRIGPKPQSVARIFIDAMSASVFCFVKLFKNGEYGLLAGLGPRNSVGVPIYKMAPDALARARDVADAPRSYDPADVGLRIELGKTRRGKQRRRQHWRPKTSVTSL